MDLVGQKQYRIIPSVFPPIDFYENIVSPDDLEVLWAIESRTNDRLRDIAGDLFLVRPEDRMTGPGASVVMAAFTHVGKPSRFTDGTYGVYYASLQLNTAITETCFHRGNFLRATEQPPSEITMRVYQGKITKPLIDIRSNQYTALHDPLDYTQSRAFGSTARTGDAWGICYNSVRHPSGHCLAIFRPPAISIPIQTQHLRYVWDGHTITQVYELKLVTH